MKIGFDNNEYYYTNEMQLVSDVQPYYNFLIMKREDGTYLQIAERKRLFSGIFCGYRRS